MRDSEKVYAVAVLPPGAKEAIGLGTFTRADFAKFIDYRVVSWDMLQSREYPLALSVELDDYTIGRLIVTLAPGITDYKTFTAAKTWVKSAHTSRTIWQKVMHRQGICICDDHNNVLDEEPALPVQQEG